MAATLVPEEASSGPIWSFPRRETLRITGTCS
jgi:hypothetical protein